MMTAAAHAGASAPGKLMIAGEYAVLEGGACLVAAVGARAQAFWSAPAENDSAAHRHDSHEKVSIPAEAMVARSRAEQEVDTRVPRELAIDVSALRRSGRKLGLGSSAAAAAAAAGAVFAWAGYEITRDAVRQRVLDAALAGHQEVAPRGSGADVAASVLGGYVRFRRQGEQVRAEPVRWPADLVARVVWTGAEARTSDFLDRLRELQRQQPERYRAAMDALAAEAERFVEAFAQGDAAGVVQAADAHGEAMRRLGEAAGVGIVEENLARVAQMARAAGGAAKPSGAGGGDVAVAFFADAAEAAQFERACHEAGMDLLNLRLGAEGLLPLEQQG